MALPCARYLKSGLTREGQRIPNIVNRGHSHDAIDLSVVETAGIIDKS
jgi:hypothetical protein